MIEDKCKEHGLFRADTCNWCGKTICKKCIDNASGRRYCPNCHRTLTKDSFASKLNKTWGEKPSTRVTNKDLSLNEKEIARKRAILEMKERAKKIYGG
ncbi:MAG: hypothetical protein ABIC91_04910 [Nanoarchaeota archaeon]|nr:hypothetical protein [Nanoarchaeota archaeon]MBU1031145.1 hypothetical protein [Nanoarchaeota archaeon]MBU1850148.1 hypothetical protein [Nanoarchaeota archaeon]